jgi:hypothetical protein
VHPGIVAVAELDFCVTLVNQTDRRCVPTLVRTRLFTMRAEGTAPRKLVGVGFEPRWSPDASLIAYTTTEGRSRTTPAQSKYLNVVDVATRKHRQVVDVAVKENPPMWWTSNTLLIQRPVR